MTRLSAPLRTWQKAAMAQALEKYHLGDTHFMCVAAPGAGKTRFSAALAQALLSSGSIDIVLCIAPSVSVANGIRDTFAYTLNDTFDGRLGSKGLVVTYQSLQFQYSTLARLIQNHRVLIVSDEIHHLAYGEGSLANQWGSILSSLIEHGNPLTLTLSGTPWRSNSTKIALQTYAGEPEELHTDFIYGLGEAVADQVCRRPSLILLDNELINIEENDKRRTFNSIRQAIEAKQLKYGDLLLQDDSLRQLISYSHEELLRIRVKSPRAAGLVVASSVEQADRIQRLLIQDYGYAAILVSYHQTNAHEKIRDFQNSNHDWIVSVGMVSEGTDIPRLQVCAYLSNVRTELYFRQVLGRILRINNSWDEQCSLVAFAEPRLVEFAERIGKDLPVESMQIVCGLDIKNLESDNSENDQNLRAVSGQPLKAEGVLTCCDNGSTNSMSRAYKTTSAFLCKDSYRTVILSL